jgi:hypothetical protein
MTTQLLAADTKGASGKGGSAASGEGE